MSQLPCEPKNLALREKRCFEDQQSVCSHQLQWLILGDLLVPLLSQGEKH